MIRVVALAAAAVGTAVAVGCSRGGYEDGAGFNDGFIAGYARACAISSPLSEGRWRNATYSRGYADGIERGIEACREERRSDSDYLAATSPDLVQRQAR